ncbi:CRISPR-associated endonuclease Cas1 [Myxococcota bacterium]|nr:CRISPR-associated endonuclease Cas1 [Myxococcota bacterium]
MGEPLLPARMLNEFAYCPRLFYLEWVEGDFRDNADTVEGRFVHRRVDAREEALPEAAGEAERVHARSVYLSDEALGLVARIDLVEAAGGVATPVDYKKGEAPDLPEGAWEPERVQVCAQGLLLRAHGYESRGGVLYFAASRRRVEVPFTAELVARTLDLRDGAMAAARSEVAPPPLVNSAKCPRCSLAPLCLPDEVNLVRGEGVEEPRRLVPARDDALPLVVQKQGATVGLSGEMARVKAGSEVLAEVRLMDVSDVSVMGAVQVTTQALREMVGRGIPVSFFSGGGWFYGMAVGLSHKNVLLRRQQYRAADDPARSLALARRLVSTKVANQRTLLRRNHPDVPDEALAAMQRGVSQALKAGSLETLLGIEGSAARVYFEHFAGMLKGADALAKEGPAFDGRNRRPPRDPVNAMLSFCYALLAKDLTVTLQGMGFDPMLGFYHQPRYGRPALALDLMEEFRPLIADSAVLTAVNNGVVKASDFERGAAGVSMTSRGRAALVECYARRMDEMATHPVFGYRISYRRILAVQARLLARHILGEIADFPGFRTR